MARINVLVVDDDHNHGKMLETILNEWGYACALASDGESALKKCAMRPGPDLALIDMRMPGMNGLQTMERIKEIRPDMPIIIMTAYSEIADAVEAMKKGAFDYLTKPLNLDKLGLIIKNAIGKADFKESGSPAAQDPLDKIIGASEPVLKMKEMIRKIAPTEATVLVQGESGTGKELVARGLHELSHRRKGPFIAINCGAMTGPLLASELFGHEKGAFTGAEKKHDGLFMEADGGTIFLDEIGEMPPDMQVKLLRVIQEKEVLSVGGKRPAPINCRIIAATNRDLATEVKNGNFREDFYYRLNVLSIKIPPLRSRKSDIPMLASYFARMLAMRNHKNFTAISPDAMASLCGYDWPGNVRELENVLERSVILMPGEYIGINELPDSFQCSVGENSTRSCPGQSPQTLEEIEKNVILRTLEKVGNNKTEAAKILGISRKTLHAKLNKYNSTDFLQ